MPSVDRRFKEIPDSSSRHGILLSTCKEANVRSFLPNEWFAAMADRMLALCQRSIQTTNALVAMAIGPFNKSPSSMGVTSCGTRPSRRLSSRSRDAVAAVRVSSIPVDVLNVARMRSRPELSSP